jgi:Flp pilus assembly protein TadG
MTRFRFRRSQNGESGSAIIEMAIALPLYLLLVFGCFECSLVLFHFCNATYACRHTARYASMRSTASLSPATAAQISAIVKSELFLGSSMTPTVTVTYLNVATGATSTNTVGNLVEVSASWSQTLPIPFMSTQNITIATQGCQIITR